jgi:murein L,D-transpeptidase YcbB/YkuD
MVSTKGKSLMLPRVRQVFAVSALLLAVLLTRDTSATAVASNAFPDPDMLVAKVLRHLVDGLRQGHILQPADRSAVEAFYRRRDFSPVWIVDGRMADRARAAINRLKDADAEGLRAADYVTYNIERDPDAKALAKAELSLTTAALAYARDAATGRVRYAEVSPDIAYSGPSFNRLEALASLASAENVAQTLISFNPPQAGYLALKQQLARFHTALAESEFKVESRLRNTRTLSLEVTRERSRLEAVIGKIALNMERWRWMPRELGANHVIVNIPDFTLHVVRDHAVVWTTRLVVGDKSSPTPIMSADMTSITLNPIWNIPKSIVEKEYLPGLDEDADRLDRLGIHAVRYTDGSLHVYQLPGEWNALGQIRFNFPNRFSVYQHDTPERYLFARSMRSYSHGCMRVEEPLMYAQTLLAMVAPEQDYTTDRIYGLLGGDEINIDFTRPIPVHLTYQTAFVDDAGSLQTREDIYRQDERLSAALTRASRISADDLAVRSFGQQPRAAAKSFAVRMANWLVRQKHRLGI